MKQILEQARLEGELISAQSKIGAADDEIVIYYFDLPKKEISLIRSGFKDVAPTVTTIHLDGMRFLNADGGFGGGWANLPKWIVTAGILILIGKGLLDGFLKELEATGARKAKETIKKLFKREKQRQQRFLQLFPGGIPKAIADKGTSISIVIKVENTTVQFAFPYRLNENKLDDALEALTDVIPLAKAVAQAHKTQKLLSFTYEDEEWKQEAPSRKPSKKVVAKKRNAAKSKAYRAAAARSRKAPRN